MTASATPPTVNTPTVRKLSGACVPVRSACSRSRWRCAPTTSRPIAQGRVAAAEQARTATARRRAAPARSRPTASAPALAGDRGAPPRQPGALGGHRRAPRLIELRRRRGHRGRLLVRVLSGFRRLRHAAHITPPGAHSAIIVRPCSTPRSATPRFGGRRALAADYDRIASRFARPTGGRRAQTHSGIPLKPCYFPHDVAELDATASARRAPTPSRAGTSPAQYQFMTWANQPVIGYGLPEQTRERMDVLAEQGMVGYFGQRFYNLVYDLVSHEGLDPDDPAARGRIGQCGMAVYCVRDMERLFAGLDPTADERRPHHLLPGDPGAGPVHRLRGAPGHRAGDLRGNSMNWYHQSAYVGMSAFPPAQGLKLAVELISYCSKHMPRWNTTNFFALRRRGGRRPATRRSG